MDIKTFQELMEKINDIKDKNLRHILIKLVEEIAKQNENK